MQETLGNRTANCLMKHLWKLALIFTTYLPILDAQLPQQYISLLLQYDQLGRGKT